jgi:hypothetical protein
MADLLLSGVLDFRGVVDLVGDAGGHVKANGVEVLVQTVRGAREKSHGVAPAPVPIPPPPTGPSELGLDVWIFTSFNATVTAGGTAIVTQGMCAQGNPGLASWPGMVQPSTGNPGVTVNSVAMNVVGDLGTILPTGAPATFTQHRQGT